MNFKISNFIIPSVRTFLFGLFRAEFQEKNFTSRLQSTTNV